MTREEAIGALMMCHELMLFDPLTGKTNDIRLENKHNQDLYYACEMAISALSAEQMWTSVKERLPDYDIPVLVTYIGCTDKKPYSDGVAKWSLELNGYNGGWEWTLDYSEVTVEITHWMPSPETPKEE